jgi:putative hydrolases of HD superfamily
VNDEQIMLLARHAMTLGTVKRGLNREDGRPESDTDHTVQVAWLACALAHEWFPHQDPGLVAQMALAHDAVEVYAGDTYAVGLDEAGRAAKREREHGAYLHFEAEFGVSGWLPALIRRYEEQAEPEARLVWCIDKIVTKISCILDGCAEVARRATPAQRREFLEREQKLIAERGEPEVAELWDRLVTQTSALIPAGR